MTTPLEIINKCLKPLFCTLYFKHFSIYDLFAKTTVSDSFARIDLLFAKTAVSDSFARIDLLFAKTAVSDSFARIDVLFATTAVSEFRTNRPFIC